MKLSIVVPVCNEAEVVETLYKRLVKAVKKDFKNWRYEIIFIDDGSSDATFSVVKNLHTKDRNVKAVQFSRNFGHHIAITAGLDQASGDYIVMMDGDLQDQPEEIIKLYRKLQDGYDVVYAVRKNKQHGFLKRFFSSLFNMLISKLIRERIVINSTIFRIITKQVNGSIKTLRESNRYVIGIIGWVGYKHGFQEVIHGARHKGKTKYNFRKQLDLALNAILSFSDYPLRLIIKVGFFFVFLSICMIGYILIKKIIYNTPVVGWSSLITSVFALGGIQIIILGIIGEYIGRNYMENKNRPLYIVRNILK